MGTQNGQLLEERWNPIAYYEGLYDVSNLGRIRCSSTRKGAVRWRIISQQLGTKGYPIVRLHKNGGRFRVRTHKLVAEAFIGECPIGKECNHKDGIKTNNRATNLEYITSLENRYHAIQLGLTPAKLSESNIHDIRLRIGSETQWSIAKDYGVSQVTISKIKSGQLYKWVESQSVGGVHDR